MNLIRRLNEKRVEGDQGMKIIARDICPRVRKTLEYLALRAQGQFAPRLRTIRGGWNFFQDFDFTGLSELVVSQGGIQNTSVIKKDNQLFKDEVSTWLESVRKGIPGKFTGRIKLHICNGRLKVIEL